ncbi:MAG: Na/Pi cotransporter family protein [Lachnospiraceae bacterium]
MMNETFKIIFGLFGGLAIFIYGMNLMSESLQKAAGEKMKSILALLTKNPVMGVIAGALATAVLQSSSATTVMAIGFVSAGLMTLPQAISIIFGANIGTTMTAQIIAFKITDYIYLFIFAGFIISFVSKSEKLKSIGSTLFAFGLLFLGIETMGSVMKPLASSTIFVELIGKVADIPILGLLLGTVMTLLVQSSSATIAVLQNFASQAGPDGVTSILGLVGALPILLGDNIGTTITALLASVGQSKNAKRTALAHCIFNISGSLVFIWFINPYAKLIQLISPKGPEVEVISRQIANAHTGFNLCMTIVWTCLIGLMVKIVMKLIPDGKITKADPSEIWYLDNNLINQPAAALQMVAKEVLHCSELVKTMLKQVAAAVRTEEKELLDSVLNYEGGIQQLNIKITDYLADLFSAGVLTEEQATQTARIMYVMSDIERISNLCGDVVLVINEKIEKKYEFTPEAIHDLERSLQLIENMYSEAAAVLEKGDTAQANLLLKQKEEIMELDLNMRKGHMARVAQGKCAASLTAPFTAILHSINRMGNSCVNIAEAVVINKVDFNYFMLDDKNKNS